MHESLEKLQHNTERYGKRKSRMTDKEKDLMQSVRYAHTYTRARAHIHICTHTHTYVHTYTHKHASALIPENILKVISNLDNVRIRAALLGNSRGNAICSSVSMYHRSS